MMEILTVGSFCIFGDALHIPAHSCTSASNARGWERERQREDASDFLAGRFAGAPARRAEVVKEQQPWGAR
jgi:hypothetical protein